MKYKYRKCGSHFKKFIFHEKSMILGFGKYDRGEGIVGFS